MKLIKLIFAFLLPPVAVFLTYGLSPAFLINLVLTLLGWVPGIIHALWVVVKHYENLDRTATYDIAEPN
jgi:uncharacterized membrane protein YqaE (UPF0057 family)